ncbi:MAG: hypothetical protein C0483_12395 [Pirellula sp.]|nr:hypothetical protein [Pirellula sp.]
MIIRGCMSLAVVLFAGVICGTVQSAEPAPGEVAVDRTQYKISLHVIERASSSGDAANEVGEPLVNQVDPKAWLKAIQGDAHVKILSAPTIVTTNGREARMTVGGEHLFTVGYAGEKAVTKVVPVGIQLTVTATALDEERVSVDLAMQVSELAEVVAMDLPAEAGEKSRKVELPTVREQTVKSTLVLTVGQAGVVSGCVKKSEDSTHRTEVLVAIERFETPR